MKPKHPIQIEIEEKIRSQQKEQSTAEAYWGWVKRFLDYCKANKIGKETKESGVPIHFVAQLMGHDSIETLQTYIHASVDGATASKSPIEMLPENAQKPPLEEMLRHPREPQAKPQLRVFAG